MIDTVTLLAFLPAALALNLTPGADMMFCLGQGLRGGPRAALAADAGISAGVLVHVLLAAVGLGAALSALPWAFEVIRWIGVAYLVVLAIQTLRTPIAQTDLPAVKPREAFRQAFIVNLTNPKVILFVLAFLPQFVDPTNPLLPQFLTLGAILSAGGFVINGAVGVFAGSLGRQVAGSRTFALWTRRVSASIFVLLAARLALAPRA